MMQSLDKDLRSALEKTVKAARAVAETAANAAVDQLGVGQDKPEAFLSDSEKALRNRLRTHGKQLGDARDSKSTNPTYGKQEVQHLMQEVAYEHWHRMLFARFLADNNLLMYDGVAVTIEECDELAPDEGAKSGWELAGKLAARMLPQVFKPGSPVFELAFAPEHQSELEQLLKALPEAVFKASDSLGWVYQFWQADNKERINRSEVKIGADELPAVTQLFTEPYMVAFLLQNSLGAWWSTRHPGKPCPVNLNYFRTLEDGMPAAGDFEAWPDSLSKFKLLDPCCGSGHFLVAAFLMLVPLLRSMDPSLEEAAAMSGARPSSTLRKVTLGVMLPGVLAVTIYQFTSALEGFEVPGILGLPAGIHVFSTKIYSVLHQTSSLPAYGEANALAMLYLFVAVISIYMYSRVIGKSERFTVITGKGYRPRVLQLGAWRWPAFGLALIYLALSTIIPFLVLAYVSFLPFLQAPSARAFAAMSWDNYETVFETDRMGRMLWNTVVMTVSVATAVMIFSFLISMIVVRSKFWGRKVLDQLAFLPHAIPGMVMGLALLWIFLQVDKLGVGLFGSLTSLVIAFTIGYVSYGTRVMNAAVLQVHKDLEEAAKVSGAPQWRVFWRVFFPLLQPAFVGVWIWTVLHVVRSAGKPLILTGGAQNEVLAVVIWNMWDQGYIESVGAIGTLLMLALLIVTLVVRRFGFGRGAHIQEAK